MWVSIVLFAASNSIVRVLSDLGAEHAIDGRNVISFCNLLFAGNVCASLVLFAVYRRQWNAVALRALSKADWLSLLALAVLTSCVAPWFFFLAIENTMVTSVVLVAQIEPPLLLAMAWLVFSERVNLVSGIGAGLCLLGVALSVLLQPSTDGFMIGKGELYAAAAAAIYALSTIVARPRIKHIPLGIFTVFRNCVGALFFFFAAAYLYGPVHFADLASPFLWQWMLVYGGIIIVGGQLSWFTGLRTARWIDVSLATSSAPIAGVLGAFLILGEQPMLAHYVGGGVLVLGIIVGLLGARPGRARVDSEPPPSLDEPGAALDAECKVGFKGV